MKPRNITVIVALVLGCLGGGFWWWQANQSPIPAEIREAATFPIMLPTSLPSGYTIDQSTFTYQDSVVSYTIRRKDSSIIVNQQSIPDAPPDIAAMQQLGFRTINVVAGRAVAGMNGTRPTAIVLGNLTLVTITGEENIPLDVLVNITEKLSSAY